LAHPPKGHWVYQYEDGSLLTARRATDEMYVSRSGTTFDLNEARVFTTPASATNAGRSLGGAKYGRRGDVPEGRPVRVYLVSPDLR
jgi:hypothetical protein